MCIIIVITEHPESLLSSFWSYAFPVTSAFKTFAIFLKMSSYIQTSIFKGQKENITANSYTFLSKCTWACGSLKCVHDFKFAGCTYVSVSLLHFLLIALHHVEMEADSNLHVCLCNCCQQRARYTRARYDWCCLSRHVEVTALVLVPDLHLVARTENRANLPLHPILSPWLRCRLPTLRTHLFLYVMRFSLSGPWLAD